jgi:hypothetical protein
LKTRGDQSDLFATKAPDQFEGRANARAIASNNSAAPGLRRRDMPAQ